MHFIQRALPVDELLRVVLLGTLVVLSVALYGSFGRPIWIDEFLHFAIAAFDTTEQAWDVIGRSTTGVNHGQTGIYMLLDFWLLKAFGANIIALRAPSLLSAGLLLCAGVIFMRLRGFGLLWQCFAILILFCQPHLMYYAGEARPYMPLAAASVGTLVFAVANPDQRRQWSVRILGAGSICFGVLMHPYFSLYWLVIFCFGFWWTCFNEERSLSVQSFKKYLDIPVCVVGSILYFSIASVTWLASHPRFDRDPFQQIPQSDLLRLFVWHHTEFFGFPERGAGLLIVISAFAFAYIFLPLKLRLRLRPALGPAVLILLALGVSGLLLLMSYLQNYWILTRQWVASIALVAVGCAWLFAELIRITTQALKDRKVIVSASTIKWLNIMLVLLVFLYGIRLNQHNLVYRVETFVSNFAQRDVVPTSHLDQAMLCPMDNQAWSLLANLNIQKSGEVWIFFRKYYEQALGGPDVCLDNLKPLGILG